MNYDQVYVKTREGEEAVHQRTRLVQRNLRTVLILIDGKSSVSELISKAGSEEVLVAALEQLERDGFIRLVSEQAAAGVDPKSMANYLEPATDEPFPSSPASAKKAAGAFASSGEVSVNPFAPPPVGSTGRPAVKSTSIDAVSISPFSVAASEKHSVAPAANPFQSAPAASPFGAPASSPFVAPAPKPAPAARPTPEVPEPVAPEPAVALPFKRHGRLLTGRRVLFGALGALALLILVAIFYPYDSYRPRVEAALSELAGQPVRVANVSASFFPGPALVLSQVSAGAGADGGGVTISEVRAVPSLWMLVGKKAFSRVTLRGTLVPMAQVGSVASALSAAGQSHSFSVGRLEIESMTLALRDIVFQDYSGRAELAPDGSLKKLSLRSTDGTMSIQVGPGATAKEPTQVLVQGQGWKSGEASPFVFDALEISGQLSGTRFVAEKIEGRIFGGVVQGKLQLDWSGGMLVSGDVNVDYMNGPQLAAALGSGSIGVEGQTSARVRFLASGASWNALAGKVPLEGSFLAKTGVINGLDFVEAVRRGSKLATRGGATRYDQMTGKFRWNDDILQLTEVDLSSGAVRATGSVAVVKGGNLTGSVSVMLKSSAATIRTPVAVVGTLKDPQLFGGRN